MVVEGRGEGAKGKPACPPLGWNQEGFALFPRDFGLCSVLMLVAVAAGEDPAEQDP